MEKAKRFLDEVMKNEALAQRLRETSTKEDFLNIAEAQGYDFSEEDLHALGDLVMVRARGLANGDLSEEELLMVAGGTEGSFRSGPQETEDFGDFIRFLFSSSDFEFNRP